MRWQMKQNMLTQREILEQNNNKPADSFADASFTSRTHSITARRMSCCIKRVKKHRSIRDSVTPGAVIEIPRAVFTYIPP